MRSNPAALALLACLAFPMAPAFADGDANDLDLTLPQAYRSLYRNDPPGTYYGDTTGVPPDTDAVAHAACPSAPDGSERALTGSATTGFGYSSGLGSSRYNALHLNYCKASATEEGSERVFNVQVDVGNYDGPGMRRFPVTGPGPGPRIGRRGF